MNTLISGPLVLLLLFFSLSAPAQQGSPLIETAKDSVLFRKPGPQRKPAAERDVTDLFDENGILKKLIEKPDTAAEFYTSVIPIIGYSLNTGFAVSIGANAAFYTDSPSKVNLSTINIAPTATIEKQFIIPLQSNLWTKGNRYDILSNLTFYKFPQNTYGLGGYTSVANAIPIDYSYFLIRETFLKQFAPNLFLGVGYGWDKHWNIKDLGPHDDHTPPDDFQKYGFAAQSLSSGPTFNFLYDSRRNPINPLPRGHYANVVFRMNKTFLGSGQNWNSVLFDLRKYIRISPHSNNVLALWSYSWFTLSGHPPYLDLPSTGGDLYANQGRGYIQGRFRGKDLIDLESEYRFALTRNRLLGAVVFANVQSPSELLSHKFEVWWPGAGTGLRLKLNKHSNTNAALDYAFGLGGSRGFFVNLGEVF